MAEPFVAEMVEEAIPSRGVEGLNFSLYSTLAVIMSFIILAAFFGINVEDGSASMAAMAGPEGNEVSISWHEPVYMPRHEECIDPANGQDPGYEGYGVGYEPSLSIDGQGNLFATAHKDLRWGGEDSPIPIFLDPDDPGLWYACSEGDETSWDYWASWFWISNDGGYNWSHGDNFDPTPGSMLSSLVGSVTGGGSECLGDEGDIAVDANDMVYYLDTTLEDNWWHIFSDGGNSYENGPVCQRMNTMAADDRPWVAAQGDEIIHYLGNSGAPPPECTGDSGRYWYYHSENGGNSFSQCYSVPGGWSTISSQQDGPYVYIAQEDADSNSGSVQVRISDDHGRGTGFSDGTWAQPVEVGPRKGNCPEGYPVVNNNEKGTVAVVWADCPNGGTGAWEMEFAISYDNGSEWESWNITPVESGINMYPFVSITEDDIVTLAYYGLDLSEGYVEGTPWYLYAGALREPHLNDTWNFAIADPTPLHNVTAYEESSNDVHALHDFFETVVSPNGTWMGIAYQQNVGAHPFEENEEQRYIKFVRGELNEMLLGSSDIEAGGSVPSKHTCDGADTSPQLMWSTPPNGTTSLELRVIDVEDGHLHWGVDGIDPQSTDFRAGETPSGEVLTNGFGEVSWGGPCPPENETHHYVFTIAAIGLNGNETTILGQGSFIATYER